MLLVALCRWGGGVGLNGSQMEQGLWVGVLALGAACLDALVSDNSPCAAPQRQKEFPDFPAYFVRRLGQSRTMMLFLLQWGLLASVASCARGVGVYLLLASVCSAHAVAGQIFVALSPWLAESREAESSTSSCPLCTLSTWQHH